LLLEQRSLSAAPMRAAKSELVAFETSPFPYFGQPPGQDKPFFDVEEDGRRGHLSPRGGVYWEDPTYSDRRVLLHIPAGFEWRRPGVMILFFHGNLADLEGVVVRRQQVPRQVAQSGLNALLVAPQLALNALDSSPGRFYDAGHLRRFLDEAATALARLQGDAGAREAIAALPVVIAAFSGGYAPAVWAAHHGGAGERLVGLILLDALYAEAERLAGWIEGRRSAFFFSAYSPSAREENVILQRLLSERGIAFATSLPQQLLPGSVSFLATDQDVAHGDFLTRAWVRDPLKVVLGRIPGFSMAAAARARKR
jgi:hypothetical protein